MEVAALVCGILGIAGGFIPVVQYFTFVLAILALIFGAVARKKGGGAMATAGLILGIIGVVITVISALVCVACLGAGAAVGLNLFNELF
jgi:hypothetical protein